jgi:hypothetical protein
MGDDRASLRTRVRRQLKEVRAVGLAWLDTSKHAALDVSLLESAAETVNNYRRTLTRTAKVDLLLRHEVGLMTASPSFQELLRTLFGLTPETVGKTPEFLRDAAAKQAYQARDHFTHKGRLEDQLLDALATQIVVDCFNDSAQPRHSLDFPEQIPLIPRPALQAEFARYVDEDRYRLISLEGEPGNGKSRLARELLRERLAQGGIVIYIRGERLLTDIAGVLSDTNFAVPMVGGGKAGKGLKESFAAYISSDRFPTYVLLDNIADAALIDELVPPSCRSLVVVTSREDALPQGRGVALPIKEMDDDEAASLVRHIRPETSDSEVELLVTVLGARPLAIVHACGFIGDGHAYTVEQFCKDLSENAATILGKAVRPIEWTLTWIYEHFLTRLQASDDEIERDAGVLLEFVSCLASEAMPYNLVALPFYHRLAEHHGRWLDGAEQRTRFTGALHRAQRAYLLEPRPDGLSMHQLTQNLLNGIVGQQGSTEVTLTVLNVSIVSQLKEKTGLNPVVLDNELVPWVPHIVKITDAIFGAIEPEKWEALDIFGALSVAMCGLRQTGRTDEAERIRGQYARTLGRLVPRLRQVGRSLRSEGFRAFALDIIGHAFDLGECSYEEYLQRISSVLGESMPGRVPSVTLNEFLGIVQRSLDSGTSPLEHVEQFTSTNPEWNKGVLPEGLAEFHRQRGEANLLSGKWQDARSDLEIAWSLYESSSDQKVKRYGQARTLKLLIDLDCYSGAGFSEESVLRLGQLEVRPEDGVLVDALAAHASLRFHTQLALYSNRYQADDSKLSEYLPDDTLAFFKEWIALISYRNLTELFLRAYTGYIRHGSPRLAIELIRDRASAWTVADKDEEINQSLEEAANIAMEHLRSLNFWPNPLEMWICAGKGALLMQEPLPLKAIEWLLEAAELAVESNRAPYFGYEGIMVGALSVEINRKRGVTEALTRPYPNVDSLRQGLESLGLGHRWGAFESAMNAIESGDEVVFHASVRALYMF